MDLALGLEFTRRVQIGAYQDRCKKDSAKARFSSPSVDRTNPWDRDEDHDERDHVQRANNIEHRIVGEAGVEQAAGDEVHQQPAHRAAEPDQPGDRGNHARLEEVRRVETE